VLAERMRLNRTMPVPAVALFSLLPHAPVVPAILAFGLAGLGCSAPVPLTIPSDRRQIGMR
jgi:hypothetical protein